MRIYLSPSSQKENPYSYGNVSEADVCYRIANYAYDALIRNGYECMIGGSNTTYQERVQQSNDWEADIHIPIHTNAGGGDGTVVFCASQSVGNRYVKSVYDAVARLSPGNDDGIRYVNNLYEINHTNSICIYIECEFHDNPDLAKWIIEHIKEIGETIAKGICSADGKSYIDNSESNIVNKIKYIVQAGAFSDLQNARTLVSHLAENGIDAIIKEI